jgi:hypothetical protein
MLAATSLGPSVTRRPAPSLRFGFGIDEFQKQPARRIGLMPALLQLLIVDA